MIRPVKFESQDRRIKQILAVLNENGIASIEEANEICEQYGIDPYTITQETQPICFENAKWAYVVGSAIALKAAEKTGDKSAATAAANIGIGLQSFCIPGSVAENRSTFCWVWRLTGVSARDWMCSFVSLRSWILKNFRSYWWGATTTSTSSCRPTSFRFIVPPTSPSWRKSIRRQICW